MLSLNTDWEINNFTDFWTIWVCSASQRVFCSKWLCTANQSVFCSEWVCSPSQSDVCQRSWIVLTRAFLSFVLLLDDKFVCDDSYWTMSGAGQRGAMKCTANQLGTFLAATILVFCVGYQHMDCPHKVRHTLGEVGTYLHHPPYSRFASPTSTLPLPLPLSMWISRVWRTPLP